MNQRSRLVRSAVISAVCASVLLGTSGCVFITPTATLERYDPTDGVQATLGSLALRNVVGIANDDGSAVSLLITLVNSGNRGTKVALQFESAGEKTTVEKYVGAGESVSFGGTSDEDQIVIASPDVPAGGLLPVYVQYGELPGTQLMVPVLGAEGIYAELAPR